jgi:hypothetical protein
MKKKTLALLVFLLLLPTSFAWWNSTWQNRIFIYVSNWSCTASYCQFPIYFNGSYGNGSDWRFIDSTDTQELGYWFEDANFSNGVGNVWVNASNNTNFIYLYYNASSAVGNKSNVDSVFLFGDDFNNQATVNASKWTTIISEGSGSCTFSVSGGSATITTPPSTACLMRQINNLSVNSFIAKTFWLNKSSSGDQRFHFGVGSFTTWAFDANGMGYDFFNGLRYQFNSSGVGTLISSPTNLPEIWTLEFGNWSGSFTAKFFSPYTNSTPIVLTRAINTNMWKTIGFDVTNGGSINHAETIDYVVVYSYNTSTPSFIFSTAAMYAFFTPPTPPNNNITNNTIITINATAYGMTGCKLIFDMNEYMMDYNGSTDYTICNYTIGGLTDGAHVFYIADPASNAMVSETRTVYVDTAPPENITFLTPTNNTQYLYNVSFVLNASEIYIKNCTLTLNSTKVNMTVIPPNTCAYNYTGYNLTLPFYATVCDLFGLCSNSSNYLISTYFNSTQITPINGSNLSGTTAVFTINTTNIYPISCGLFINGVEQERKTINESSNATFAGFLLSSGSWWFSCYSLHNESLIMNSSTRNFTAVNSTFSDYYNLLLSTQAVYASPQILFYDVNNKLNVLYYVQNFTDYARIATLNGSTIERNLTVATPRANDFAAIMRLANSTLLLTFNRSDNSTAQFIVFNDTSITATPMATTFSAKPNSIYDPNTYTYTKQFPSLDITPDSYYLFFIQDASSTKLIKMNATLNSSGVSALNTIDTYTPTFTWQTIANNSNLTTWYYAIPTGSGPYSITIYYYNGTASTSVATPDSATYSAAQIANAKVLFEEYNNTIYFVQSNTSNFVIYRLKDGKKWTQGSSTITFPSNFLFIDEDTFVFFSAETAGNYTYSCYFGGSAGNCTRISATDYGITVPFARGTMVTSKRTPSLTGPYDVVSQGAVFSIGNNTRLYYKEYTYDLKIRCFDEVNLTRNTMNVRIFSSDRSAVMSPSVYVYGYAASNALLGSGTRKVYAQCYGGTSRMYLYDPNVNPKLDVFSLTNTAPHAYYTFFMTDCYGLPSRNTLVTMSRFMSDRQDYAIVEQAYSSLSGDAALFLDPFVIYKMKILTADGLNLTQDFIPSTSYSISLPLGCGGERIVTPRTYESAFENLSYSLTAIDESGKNVLNAQTNNSFTIQASASSSKKRIISTNFLVFRVAPNGKNDLILNLTRTDPAGANFSLMINNSTGSAYYSAVMTILIVNEDINNENLTLNLSSYKNRATIVVRGSVSLVTAQSEISSMRENLQRFAQSGGGWAWFFITTILTMLVVGYVSKYTIDGAGIVGALFFLGMAVIGDVTIYVGDWAFQMWRIGVISLIAAILIIIWRYI